MDDKNEDGQTRLADQLEQFRVELFRDAHVYAVTPIEGVPVALYIQQCRALRLVSLLDGQPGAGALRGKRLVVIGGGVAGLTAAAAAAVCGASVSLLERSSQLLPAQAGCHHRYLHPRIHEWPDEKSFMSSAHLPIMTWSAGTAHQVAESLLREFAKVKRYADELEVLTAAVVEADPERVGSQLRVTYTYCGDRNHSREADFVIVATGFTFDGVLAGIPSRPYWRTDALSQSILQPAADNARFTIAILGGGDGGALDVLRARLQDFDHGPFLDRFLSVMQDAELGRVLREKIELQAEGFPFKKVFASDTDIPQFARLRRTLTERLRPDTRVLWYMSGFRGFKYNSFLAYLLTRIDENTVLKEHGGPIIATHVRYAKAGFAVGFTNQRESEAVDDVVPRFRAKRRDGDFGGRFEMKRAVPGTDRYRLTTDVFKKFWTLAGPLRARGLYVSSSRSVGKVNVSDEEWICYEIVLTAPAAGRARWVEYILHPEEGEVRRRVEADRDSARTLFTWNDYWVEAVLDDGTIIPGDWLSNLIEDREVQGVLRTQAERLTGVPRSLAERPAPNSRRIDRTLEGTLLSEIHAEFQNS